MLHIVLFWVQYLPCGFLLSRGASTGFGGLEKKELCFIACCCWLLHRSRQISNHAWGYQLYKEALTACICRTQHLKWEQRMVKMHMTVLLLKTFAVSSLWLRLYCCCCFSVERDAALLVLQTFSAYDKPCVAVSFVAGRHSASKSVANVRQPSLAMMKYSDSVWSCQKISQFLLDMKLSVLHCCMQNVLSRELVHLKKKVPSLYGWEVWEGQGLVMECIRHSPHLSCYVLACIVSKGFE